MPEMTDDADDPRGLFGFAVEVGVDEERLANRVLSRPDAIAKDIVDDDRDLRATRCVVFREKATGDEFRAHGFEKAGGDVARSASPARAGLFSPSGRYGVPQFGRLS